MPSFHRCVSLAALTLPVLFAPIAMGQVGGPPGPPTTVWNYVGIPQGVQKIKGAMLNRHGDHPCLEPKPPLKALADPANLESPDASIKKAAEVKMAEDLKKQKIKAVKYLTQIGCGCYDTDGGVSAALAASMTDCTEDVRYETIQAVAEAAQGKCCSKCGQVCCCNKTILTQLAKTAYERDDHGCYLEPSERVREAAAQALRICCPNTTAPMTVPREGGDPRETPGKLPEPKREAVEGEGTEPLVPPSPVPPSAEQLPRGAQSFEPKPLQSAREGAINWPIPTMTDGRPARWAVVEHFSADHRLAHIHLNQEDAQLAVGTVLPVHSVAGDQLNEIGQLQVVESFPGSANVTGSNELLALLKPRDVVLVPAMTVAEQPTQEAETQSQDVSSRTSQGPVRAAFDGVLPPAATAAAQPLQAAEPMSLNDAATTRQDRREALRMAFDSPVGTPVRH